MLIKEKIQHIKQSRLSPAERFLYDIFWNLKLYSSGNFSDIAYYKKNDEVLFEHKKNQNYFICHYSKIWTFLETSYGLNYHEIKCLIKDISHKTLNLDVSPSPGYILWK